MRILLLTHERTSVESGGLQVISLLILTENFSEFVFSDRDC